MQQQKLVDVLQELLRNQIKANQMIESVLQQKEESDEDEEKKEEEKKKIKPPQKKQKRNVEDYTMESDPNGVTFIFATCTICNRPPSACDCP